MNNQQFHLRYVLVLLLLAAALQQASSSSSSVVSADYPLDSEVLLAESSANALDEMQLVALKESHRDGTLPMVRS